MNIKIALIFTIISSLFLNFTAFAHHSDAGIDESKSVELQGTVKEFRWRQPHVYLEIETIENGEPVSWGIQFVGINILTRQGWTKDTLTSGDPVIVQAHPALSGRKFGKMQSITRSDGSPVVVTAETEEVALVSAESMHGRWSGRNPSQAANNNAPPPPPLLVDPEHESEDKSCSGGFDCFFIQNLVLTDAAKQARASYDALSSENPESTCVGRPTPAALASSRGYLQEWDLSEQAEKIIIHSEWFNEKRTVWMDGRSHPDPSETFVTGHSIGQWLDDTLIVDTRNFDDHRSPYQIGVPSGSQKHVIERYTLSDDKTAIHVEFMLEDPEFIAKPLVRKSTLYHSAHMQMHTADCDPENTSEFINY